MRIGRRQIDSAQLPYIIAELGVNHDGRPDHALALVDAAHRAGADAIKLQYFEADRLLGKAARLAAYQQRAGAADPLALLGALELSRHQMVPIVQHAHERNLHAIVSIFSVELVTHAEQLPFDAYKTASTDIIHRPLIEAMIATGKPLILSTGAATLDEIADATAWLGNHPHLLMHCVSSYPTPDEDAALAGRLAMLPVNPNALGYSDHTTALDTGALAVASGACLLEKHLTLDRAATGPDHEASLNPDGLTEYIRLARRAWRMRGPIEKTVSDIERDVRAVSRQSITAARELPVGHVLTAADLTIKRPGSGLSPARLDSIIGCRLARPIEAGMPLTEQDLALHAEPAVAA